MIRKLWVVWVGLALIIGLAGGGAFVWHLMASEVESFSEWTRRHPEETKPREPDACAYKRGSADCPLVVEGKSSLAGQRKAYEKAREEAEKSDREWHLVFATWAIGGVTVLLAGGTGVLAFFTYELWRDTREAAAIQTRNTRRSLLIAINGAKSSQRSARATQQAVEDARQAVADEKEERSRLERARIYGGCARHPVRTNSPLHGLIWVPSQTELEIHINNQGRGPAILRRIRWGFSTPGLLDMSPTPIYKNDLPFVDSVPPGAQSKLVKIVDNPNPGGAQIIFVRFDYFDIFLQREEWAGFAQSIIPGQQLTIPAEAPEGYVRHT